MTKEQLIEAVSAHYDELNTLNKTDSFYDYENDFIKIWGEMGREIFEKNLGELPGDRRKKNSNRVREGVDSQKPSIQQGGK